MTSYSAQRSKARNQRRRNAFLKQKLMGIAILLISAGVIWLASTGVTVEERDCTAVLLTIPAGFYLLLTRHIVIA